MLSRSEKEDHTMSKSVQMTLSAAATALLLSEGKTQIRVSDFGKAPLPSFVGRKKCKSDYSVNPKNWGYNAAYELVDGCAVITTSLANWNANMKSLPVQEGTYPLQDITLGRYLARPAVKESKKREGKPSLYDANRTVTIALVGSDDEVEVQEPDVAVVAG
jgi:hypothetical protein